MRVLPLLRHLSKARTRIRLHSPFVFELANAVFYDQRTFYAFREIEALRKQFLQDQTLVERVDFGAGLNGRKERIAQIARKAAVSPSRGRMLFKLSEHLQSRRILELGTSLGIGSAYLAAPDCHEQLITLEGDPVLARYAAGHLARWPGVAVRSGAFADTLLPALEQLQSVDLVSFDGDHTEKGTLQYVHACLPFRREHSCFVLDDIHWSSGMERAWAQLIRLPEVSLSIDLFHTGLLFFRPEQREKEHFILWP